MSKEEPGVMKLEVEQGGKAELSDELGDGATSSVEGGC